MLYKITLLNKNKYQYFVADTFCRSFNLKGERNIMNTAARFCARCIIYTCHTTIRKKSNIFLFK